MGVVEGGEEFPRMSTTMTAPAGAGQAVGMEDVPDPQVPAKAQRRTYTARYKAKVLAEYEACDREIGRAHV